VDHQHTPSSLAECNCRASINFAIPGDLRAPELVARRRPLEERAVVAMPETPMDKHDRVPTRKNEVGTSWKIPDVQSKAEATSMQSSSDE
jgi:hypothetical protein